MFIAMPWNRLDGTESQDSERNRRGFLDPFSEKSALTFTACIQPTWLLTAGPPRRFSRGFTGILNARSAISPQPVAEKSWLMLSVTKRGSPFQFAAAQPMPYRSNRSAMRDDERPRFTLSSDHSE